MNMMFSFSYIFTLIDIYFCYKCAFHTDCPNSEILQRLVYKDSKLSNTLSHIYTRYIILSFTTKPVSYNNAV